MELFKFIRLGIIFIGVGLSNCSTPGEYKIQGTATGIGQGMVCIISYLDKKADTLAKAEIKEEKFELKGKVSNLTIDNCYLANSGEGYRTCSNLFGKHRLHRTIKSSKFRNE